MTSGYDVVVKKFSHAAKWTSAWCVYEGLIFLCEDTKKNLNEV